MGTHTHIYTKNMKLPIIIGLAVSASANFINNKEANEVLGHRERRGLGEIVTQIKRTFKQISKLQLTSDFEKECLERQVCPTFVDFKQGAENIYGRKLFRRIYGTEKVKISRRIFNAYRDCHKENTGCRRDGNNCRCNQLVTERLTAHAKGKVPDFSPNAAPSTT